MFKKGLKNDNLFGMKHLFNKVIQTMKMFLSMDKQIMLESTVENEKQKEASVIIQSNHKRPHDFLSKKNSEDEKANKRSRSKELHDDQQSDLIKKSGTIITPQSNLPLSKSSQQKLADQEIPKNLQCTLQNDNQKPSAKPPITEIQFTTTEFIIDYSEQNTRICSEKSAIKICMGSGKKYVLPSLLKNKTTTASKRKSYHRIRQAKSKLFSKSALSNNLGIDLYEQQSKLILEKAKSSHQVALSICEPSLSKDEEKMIGSNTCNIDEIIKSWSIERLLKERRWIYVEENYKDIYMRIFKFIAFADNVMDVFDDYESEYEDQETEEDSFKLWDENVCPMSSVRLPQDGKVSWTSESSYNMQECIFSFLDGLGEQWKSVLRKKENGIEASKDFKQFFTKLVALTLVMYNIDHWHSGAKIIDEDLCDIARLLSIRWKKILSYSNEDLGLDMDGRNGVLALMLHLEHYFISSPANITLRGKFKFCF